MKKVEKPELNEQKWEEIERTINNEAMEYGSFLEFSYWEDGFFHCAIGTCEFVNLERKQFQYSH
ncbi:YolD-like family protein [Salicibibacter kimchii]|uniref:YolD-like family protein n=1 Tax=Salicibibacter kimchii TaxID=2099786 RepID=A0A345C0L3_9BACI|nr:hypothetical protein DT065_12480 [Salicibibacter kimchii]